MKTVKVYGVVGNLPELSQRQNNEEDINQYMKVLRKTNQEIGQSLLIERVEKKAEEREFKRLQNINIVKNNLNRAKNDKKNSIKKKIKEMRQNRIFPLPKSYMNYKKRNGLLGRNSIKVKT